MFAIRDGIFASGGGAALHLQQLDWGATALGPVKSWSSQLSSLLGLCLRIPHPSALLWGPDLTLFYNDAYGVLVGSQHPRPLGQPGGAKALHLGSDGDELLACVLERGQDAERADVLVRIERVDHTARAYYTLSLSPIADGAGQLAGVFVAGHETTERVLQERRIRALERLGRALGRVPTPAGAIDAAVEVLSGMSDEHSFVLVYTLGAEGLFADLADSWGLESGHPLAPGRLSLTDPAAPWPLSAARDARRSLCVAVGGGAAAAEGSGASPELRARSRGSACAFVVPLGVSRDAGLAGMLVVGLRRGLRGDEDRRRFLETAAAMLALRLCEPARPPPSTLKAPPLLPEASPTDFPRHAARAWNLGLFAQVPVPIAVFEGSAHRCTLANPPFCELFPGHVFVGRPIGVVVLEASNAPLLACFDQVFASGEPFVDPEYLLRVRSEDGVLEERFFNLRLHPTHDQRDEVDGVIVLGVEVTAQVVARTLLGAAVARAEKAALEADHANSAKDQFLAVVSHELRSPLNAMLGWTRMLRCGQVPEEKQGRALEIIERNARAQAQLVEDLLDISRIIAGKLQLKLTSLDLVRAVEMAVEAARPSAEIKGIRLSLSVEPPIAQVVGDSMRMQQILGNLLTNSLKFTKKGGEVRVRVEGEPEAIAITIEDTGQGISPAFLPHVFERFCQQDGNTTRSQGGLGLGLAIVKHLVDLHGGTIFAHSDGEGRGSRFDVHLALGLPLPDARPGTPVPPEPLVGLPPSAVTAALRDMDVLVVDDQADAREMLSSLLVLQGARVRCATDVAEAMRLFGEQPPDVLLSDIGMPEVDGYALIAKIRALPPERGGLLPVVAVSAFASTEDRRRALRAGFTLHVAKPVEPSELLAVLATVGHRGDGI